MTSRVVDPGRAHQNGRPLSRIGRCDEAASAAAERGELQQQLEAARHPVVVRGGTHVALRYREVVLLLDARACPKMITQDGSTADPAPVAPAALARWHSSSATTPFENL